MTFFTLQTLDRVALVNKRFNALSRTHSKWAVIARHVKSSKTQFSKREYVVLLHKLGYMCDICYDRIPIFAKKYRPTQPFYNKDGDKYTCMCNTCFSIETVHQATLYLNCKSQLGFSDFLLYKLVTQPDLEQGIDYKKLDRRLDKRLLRFNRLSFCLNLTKTPFREDSRIVSCFIRNGKPNLHQVLSVTIENNFLYNHTDFFNLKKDYKIARAKELAIKQFLS